MRASKSFFFSSLLFILFLQANARLEVRQSQSAPPGGSVTPSATLTPTPTPTPTPSPTSSPTSAEPTTTPTTTPTTPASTPTSTPASTPTTPSATTPTTPTTPAQNLPTTSPSVILTTANGSTVFQTQTNTLPGDQTTPSASAPSNSASSPPSDDDSGLSTGSIVGLSVAGGVALIGIVGFFIWKFTRKRFSDFDDNEAIKWPDLNTHGTGAADSHPLPVKNTGRSGFDTGSEGSLSRVPSTNYSTPDFASSSADPYAVPPLPHMNPNQPYRDDPAASGAYYDPYHGPIPGTIEHGAPGGQQWGGEAIPMTQMAGRMSPGPHAAYGAEPAYEYDIGNGRQSPGPQAAYGRTPSPGPQAAYGGRMSPGPQAAYGGAMHPQSGPAHGGDYHDGYARQ